MTYGAWVATGAVALSVLGMMLVIGGVVTAGLFLPGVILIGLSLVGYGAAAVLQARQAGPARRAAAQPPPRQ
jgi:hypothetical protein